MGIRVLRGLGEYVLIYIPYIALVEIPYGEPLWVGVTLG